ncbi:hypothetical protein [Neptunomonas antarctica]|uniref:Uncharacterized protein n=1 Tax=Neptunomonas antarctica TaxID=619304 RepID=A0A1N7M1A2_9GAMM|nr:hypothetical protein [Neptunomonas antarctica]SIS79711.1 hypothetical protein SAMN05421760_10562 [Neptunomonas antarctica]
MVSSISGNSFQSFMPQQSTQSSSLTADQQQLVKDTLAEFDSEALTESDAQAIVEAFAEAGIQPGRALEYTMAAEGFDALSIGDMAGVQESGQGGPPPPPPPPSGTESTTQGLNISDELLSELNDLLNNYYSDDQSDEEKVKSLNSIQEILQASAPEGGLIHVTA